MTRLKNILAENMLRFGPKNLSESDIRNLQRLMEATETADMTSLNTALANLNSLIKSIPNRNKQDKKYELSAYEKYFDYGYSLQLVVGNWWNDTADKGKGRWEINTNAFDTDLGTTYVYRDPDYDYMQGKGLGTYTKGKLITPGLSIALFKSNVGAGGVTTDFKTGVYAPEQSNPNVTKHRFMGQNNIEKHVEDLLEAATYVNKKDYSTAVDMINNQIKPALNTVATEIDNFLATWPLGKQGELTWSSSGYTLTFSDPTESESGAETTANQSPR
jgi:hypothetical protein